MYRSCELIHPYVRMYICTCVFTQHVHKYICGLVHMYMPVNISVIISVVLLYIKQSFSLAKVNLN